MDIFEVPLKFSLSRVRLNSGGYDRAGRYYGVGLPLWAASCDDYRDGEVWEFRASDRASARELVMQAVPGATFYR